MWAFKRRLNIILLILGFLVFGVVIPYISTHIEVPTCFDKKQNQGEGGVDCGGPCALICKGGAKDIAILWSRLEASRDGVYEAAFEVENSNFDVGAGNIPYTITLKSSDGTVLAERKKVTFAQPNERFMLFEGSFNLGDNIPTHADLKFGEFSWITFPSKENLLRVENKVLTGIDSKPKLTAEVFNDRTTPVSRVEVGAIIKDDAGNVVGYGKTLIDTIPPRGSAPIVFTWGKPFVYEAEFEACSEPVDIMLLFDRSGSMSSDNESPPEPLTTAKNAATLFIEKIQSIDQVGLVSFATTPSEPIDKLLTRNPEDIKLAISRISIHEDGKQYTNIGDTIRAAKRELSSIRRNKLAKPFMVLLTDGIPSYPEDPENKNYPSEYALSAATDAKDSGISLYTIGLGSEVKGSFLETLASSPEQYYSAATSQELVNVYKKIASAICKKGPSVIEVIPRVNDVSVR